MSQKVVEIDREKLVSILQTALAEPAGAEIFIPCSSKREQQDLHTCLVREIKIMSEIDPADSAALTHRAIFKDGRFWVVLRRVEPSLSAVYIKRDGVLKRVGI